MIAGFLARTGFRFAAARAIARRALCSLGLIIAALFGPVAAASAQAPAVASVAPNSGPAGTTVTIAGGGFSTATAVNFGGTPATSFTVIGNEQMTAVAPAGAGTVDITVTNPSGTSSISPVDRFTYLSPPTVTSISPTAGPVGGGTTVTITGSNFTGATAVMFGGTSATFTVNTASRITATSPPGAGTVDVTVTGPGGTSATSAADQFTYTGPPAVTSVSPGTGPSTGGTSVTITGKGFSGATSIMFGATGATGFTVNSDTSITATSPAGTGTVDVTVTTPIGTSPTSAADQFNYTNGPTVTAVSPASGPAAGGTSVTVTGTNFTGATAVKFGASNATGFTVNSATSITATSPAGTGTVDITVTTPAGTSAISAADRFGYASSSAQTTQTTLASSQNPSSSGQSVTFTATVTSAGGTPTGTVTFSDNGTPIGSATLAAGTASFATSSLAVGSHPITASYSGNGAFGASTSPALPQSVSVPGDSVKLRALQLNITKLVAQESGQAISGAIDSAISEGFSDDGGSFASTSGTGMRFNFAADPAGQAAQGDASDRSAYASNNTSRAGGRAGSNPRIDNAFAAIDRQMPAKAPPKTYREASNWLFWIDVRGSIIDRWSGSTAPGTGTAQSSLSGGQVNALMGLTYKMAPNVLVGAIAGYENFNYTEQNISGKLTGDGWTVGPYLGWKITPTLRYDAAVAYSGIGYNGIAGAAQGNFNGNRWLFATGLTGTYRMQQLLIEPSARVYALWEHENAYVDTLGTLQTARDFTTGRASGGVKLSYPLAWRDNAALAPYAGIYGDYYFNRDDAAAIGALASTPLLDGWSARLIGGLNARLAGGAMLGIGGEYGGIGGDIRIWRLTAKARVPFN
ncbi:IPT/TIG domain-containing protein [Bradyrhizobium genosp. L]|uniref:IPT/TIG domain-containing protein n=1 Tax=Bradyrhizobium genosp. L TaxID=83637 RepID=UPI001FEE578D|nr:IPT/TIG domain-containing protein [Bradyrhizobium genosp. L]